MSSNTFTTNLQLPILSSDTKGGVYEFNRLLVKAGQNVALAVKNMLLSDPPDNPFDGDAYYVEPQGTGAWFGHGGKIAYYDNGWYFILPQIGALIWDEYTDTLRTYGTNGLTLPVIIDDIAGGAGLSAIRDKGNEILVVMRDHGLILTS